MYESRSASSQRYQSSGAYYLYPEVSSPGVHREHIRSLREAFAAVCEKLECELVSFDGEQDHVHLLVRYPPTLSMSALVNVLKSASSKRLRTLHPELKRLGKTSAIWSRSYFACSVGGAPLEVLRRYIENQKAPE